MEKIVILGGKCNGNHVLCAQMYNDDLTAAISWAQIYVTLEPSIKKQ